MGDYQKHKERTNDEYYTGFYSIESGTVVRGRYAEVGGKRTTSDVIDYNVGNTFNKCAHVKRWTMDMTPAFCACFCQNSFKGTGGQPPTDEQPAGKRPTVKLQDSEIMGQRPVGDSYIEASAEEIAQARYDAYQKLIHLVPAEHMNFARSAIELKDTKQTINQLCQFTKWVNSHGGRTLKLVNRAGKKVFRKVDLLDNCASLASAYLWYSFGVEPTVSDVKTFCSQCSKGSLKVLGSKTRIIPKGTTMVYRYSARPKAVNIGKCMFTNGWVDSSGRVTIDKVEQIQLVRGTTWYTASTYLTPPRAKRVVSTGERGAYFAQLVRDVEISQSEDLSKRMEWNCPIGRTLWDITPFSFLLDWFVDVGQLIENLDHWSVGKRYRTSMTPIWQNVSKRSETYIPSLQYWGFRSIVPGDVPDSWGHGGYATAMLRYKAAPALVGAETSFTRGETSAPGLPPLVIQSEVKAYQISSGMALLMQFANGLR